MLGTEVSSANVAVKSIFEFGSTQIRILTEDADILMEIIMVFLRLYRYHYPQHPVLTHP